MAAIVAPNIVTDGLVACWDAGNRVSYPGAGTVWTDVAAGNNAALQNYDEGDFSSDDMGYVSFDGTDQYAEAPGANLNLTDKVSLFSYVRFADSANFDYDGVPIMGKDFSGGATFALEYTDRKIKAALYAGSWTGFESDFLMSVDTWYYVGFTYDRVNVKVYGNGAVQATTAETDALSGDTTGTFNFGAGTWAGSPFFRFTGDIALVKLYNRALTAAEVAQNYNATKGRF